MRMNKRLLAIFAVFVGCGGGSTTPALDTLDTVEQQSDRPKIDAIETGTDGQDFGSDFAEATMDSVEVVGDTGQDIQGDTVSCKEGDPCDDNDPCTFGERCHNGECVGGQKYVCDDGKVCTEDKCDGKGNCSFTLVEGYCLIGNICYQEGAKNPLNDCLVCNPSSSKGTWTEAEAGTSCDPTSSLDQCTIATEGNCDKGVCVATNTAPKDCDDKNPCTLDTCDKEKGCLHEPQSNIPCQTQSLCAPGVCMEGHCLAPPEADCDDGNPCTEDECDPTLGCLYTKLDNVPCDDSNACTLDDKCVQGVCTGVPLNCNDGNICTLDACDPITGCYHDIEDNACCQAGVSICDDGNICTDDFCDPETFACQVVFNNAACNDNDPCTQYDSCSQGVCAGIPIDCNDNNPCTVDECVAGRCTYTILDQVPCNDGLDCSVGDHCEMGKCVADKSGCVCEPDFSPTVTKITSMTIASTGYPGQGLDVDQNPATCAPLQNGCSGGVDNALGPIASLGNADIQKSLDRGQVIALFEYKNFRTDGQPFSLGVLVGKRLDPSNPNCDFQTQQCQFIVDKNSYNEDCNPLVSFSNARVIGNKLVAGGKNYVFPFRLPITAGLQLEITLYFARIEAEITIQGSTITQLTGVLGGAVPKQQIIDAVMAVPDDQLPLPKDTIIGMIDALIQPDIDGDGDGKKESASIGIQITAIPATITGVE